MLFQPLEEEWKKDLEKDDIIIYTRHIEGSKFKEFLAEASMNGTIDKFIEVFTDIEAYPNWMPDCKSVEIIDSPTPFDITYHLTLKVPFPFANRDMVQQLVLNRQDSSLEIDLINRPNEIPEYKKHVRIQNAVGHWRIEEKAPDKLDIEFQYHADPGGDIPAWLANTFIVKSPHTTLRRIKKMLAE